MASPRLDVWLYGVRVAHLTEPSRFRHRLDFTEDAFDTFGVGSRVLSLALPLTRTPTVDARVGAAPVRAFLEGLLPEGNVRQQVSAALGVSAADTMALLAGVGGECAGAIQFLPAGESPGIGEIVPLAASEVELMVTSLPTYHWPDGMPPQASLAGIQDKVLLTRLDEGWGWPRGGAASTHLIKPEPTPGPGVPARLIESEHWAQRLARRAGLPAASTELVTFGARSALVVTRYDRTPQGRRLHQEDFCQALGLDPQAKYESSAEYDTRGGRLRRVCSVAADRAADPSAFREQLLRAVTFNVLVGNGDAHSKNYSLVLEESGEVRLAPLYDVAPVMYLDGRFKSTGHVLSGRTHLDWVGIDDLVREGASWGIPSSRARAVVADTMARVRDAAGDLEPPDADGRVAAGLASTWRRLADG